MTVKYAWVAGDVLTNSNWSLSSSSYQATSAPGPSDAAYLNGKLMTMANTNEAWNPGAISDGGLAGVVNMTGSGASLTVVGAITTTVPCTAGFENGIISTHGASQSVACGSLAVSGGGGGIGAGGGFAPSISFSGGANVNGSGSTGVSIYSLAGNIHAVVSGNITVGTGATGLLCNGNTNATITNVIGNVTASGAGATAIFGSANVTGQIAASSGAYAVQQAPIGDMETIVANLIDLRNGGKLQMAGMASVCAQFLTDATSVFTGNGILLAVGPIANPPPSAITVIPLAGLAQTKLGTPVLNGLVGTLLSSSRVII
jgi:hypothetical protein